MSPPRWRPLPSLAGLDARIRGITHQARGVLFLLICAADADGVVHHAGDPDAVDALAGPDAGACLTELLAFDLAVIDDGDLVLPDVPRWQAEHAPGSAPAVSTNPAPVAREAVAEGGEVDRRTASRRLQKQWTKRGLKDADSKVRWLSSESGRAYLEESGIPVALATAIAHGDATPTATPPATPRHPVAEGGATPPATPPATPGFPSHSPSGEKSERERGEEKARGRATPTATPAVIGATPERHPYATPGAPPASDRGGPRHGATPSEPSPTPSPKVPEGSTDEVLHDLAQRSEGGFSVSGSVDQREAVVAALLAAGVDLDAAGAALQRPWEVWPRWARIAEQRHVSVAQLAGKAPYACAGVAELVAYVRAQGAAPISVSTVPSIEETAARVRAEDAERAAIAKNPPRPPSFSEVFKGRFQGGATEARDG